MKNCEFYLAAVCSKDCFGAGSAVISPFEATIRQHLNNGKIH